MSPCGWFGLRDGLTSGSVLPRGRNGRRRGMGGINIGSGIKCAGVAEVWAVGGGISLMEGGRYGRRRGTGRINIGSDIKCAGVAEV